MGKFKDQDKNRFILQKNRQRINAGVPGRGRFPQKNGKRINAGVPGRGRFPQKNGKRINVKSWKELNIDHPRQVRFHHVSKMPG